MIIFDQILPQLPKILRGAETWKAWLRVIATPIQTVRARFDLYSDDVRYDLEFNGQVMYLQHRLNDTFDATQRRIYIDDPQPTNITPSILTNRGENQPTLTFSNRSENVATPNFYNISELQTQFDFVVFAPPSVLNYHQNSFKAIVNYYRVAGKIWTFQTI